MSKWWIIGFGLLLSCSAPDQVNYQDLDIQYLNEIPKFEQNGAPFSGVAIEIFSDVKLEHYIETGLEVKQLGYYLSGEKEREFHFVLGKKHGDCKMWWKDGTLLLEEHYEQGDLHGEVKRYYPDGSILESKTYVKGMLELAADTVKEPLVDSLYVVPQDTIQ